MNDQWWKTGIIYQIYPRSFQDSDGDGVGDLEGIRRRLGYLERLGVDAVWISPIFVSPMADFGYDVADYCAVDPLFGTMADFDRLVLEAHGRGLKVILDFVPNHTSDQHPWFIQSRSSRNDPKRDWYIWRDPAPDGGPPNNWLANFGGSAWTLDPPSGQYYHHAYLVRQPDLNWRNPEVRAAMHEVMRFWLDRGVDGFRIDVLWHLIKDAKFRDNPPNPAFRPGQASIERLLPLHSADQPEVQEVAAELRRVVDAYPDRVLIGEIYLPVERLVAYYGKHLDGVQLPFNFQLIEAPWDAGAIAAIIRTYEAALPPGGWPNWVLGNHDRPRVATRAGADQSRVAAMLLLTLRGTPTLYYGDELGLRNVAIPPGAVQDPWEKQEPGLGLGRDPVRTPMPWEDIDNAGFTAGKPWLPLNPDWRQVNVHSETADPDSVLGLYRRIIALRRTHEALRTGDCANVAAEDGVLRFERRAGSERLLVALNMTHDPRPWPRLPDGASGQVLISTRSGRADPPPGEAPALSPDEGVVIRLRDGE